MGIQMKCGNCHAKIRKWYPFGVKSRPRYEHHECRGPKKISEKESHLMLKIFKERIFTERSVENK